MRVRLGRRHCSGVDLLVVGDQPVRLGRGAYRGRHAWRGRARAQERVRVPGVRPQRVGAGDRRHARVVADELAAALGGGELGRRRHGRGGGPAHREGRQVRRGGHAEVHVPGELSRAVLPVVVGGHQGSAGREGGPLEPLVGALLPRGRVDHRHQPLIDGGPGERGPAVAGDAEDDLVVAGPGRLDTGVQVGAERAESGGRAPVGLVGVTVDVGAVGDHDLAGLARVHSAGGVVGRPEHRVLRGALLRDAGPAGVLAALVGGAVRQVVVVAHQGRGAEGLPAVGGLGQQYLVVVVAAAGGGVVEVGVGDVQRAVGGGERVGELVLVAGPLRGRQAEGVRAQRTGRAHHHRAAEGLPVVVGVHREDVAGAVRREERPGHVDPVAERAGRAVVDRHVRLVVQHRRRSCRRSRSRGGR